MAKKPSRRTLGIPWVKFTDHDGANRCKFTRGTHKMQGLFYAASSSNLWLPW